MYKILHIPTATPVSEFDHMFGTGNKLGYARRGRATRQPSDTDYAL